MSQWGESEISKNYLAVVDETLSCHDRYDAWRRK